MSSEKKRSKIFRFLNLFDIILILLIIIGAAVLFFSRSQSPDAPTAEVNTITYTIEITGLFGDTAELIAPGDSLVDRVKKYDMGTVVDVEFYPTVRQSENRESGGMIDAELSTQNSALLTVSSTCTQTATAITLTGGYVIRVGTAVSVRGPGYHGTGFILSIER